jgi:hypothetical protein
MNTNCTPRLDKTWGRLVAEAWENRELEQRLLADPRGLLAENGIELPASLPVEVVRDDDVAPSESVLYLPYPPPPNDELSDAELDAVAGGGGELVGRQTLDSSGIGERSLDLSRRVEPMSPDLAAAISVTSMQLQIG